MKRMISARLAAGLLIALGLTQTEKPASAVEPSREPQGFVVDSARLTPEPGFERHDQSDFFEHARWIGRFDRRDPLAPACAWSYCGVALRIHGTGLNLALSGAGDIQFYVKVDGVEVPGFTTTGDVWSSSTTVTNYNVVSNLKLGIHEIEIYRGPEAFFGAVSFHGSTAKHGEIVGPPPPHPTRKLEVIGDSISAGYGDLGCPFSTATEDGFEAYGPVAGRLTGADVRVEGWSGIGILLNNDGSTDGTMPAAWPLSVPTDPTSNYDCRRWTADAVVINLGTNDFAVGVSPAAYIAAYESFIDTLRACYPRALILCAINDANDLFSASIDQIVAHYSSPRVQKINLNTPNWDGCDHHPNVLGQEAMGVNLAARLTHELGW